MNLDLKPISAFRYNQISNFKFQFLLITPEGKALHSPFQCKDYLQDIFWSENTGNTAEIYGIHWNPGMLDISVDYFYMALLGGSVNMDEKIFNILALIHQFEKSLGFPSSEVFLTDNHKNVVLKFHKSWVANGPLLSSLTTIIRLGAIYEEGQDVIEYLNSLKDTIGKEEKKYPRYMNVEVDRLPFTIKKLAALSQGKMPDFPWSKCRNVDSAHNTGIMEFRDFPQVSV